MIKLLPLLKLELAAAYIWSQRLVTASFLLFSLNVHADWVVSRHSMSVCDVPFSLYQTAEETEEPGVTEEPEKEEQPEEEEEEEPDCD